MFIVYYKSGSFDDSYLKDLFIIKNEEEAKKYCIKANKLLLKVKDFFNHLDSELEKLEDSKEEINDKNSILMLWCKYQDISEINYFDYKEIEER